MTTLEEIQARKSSLLTRIHERNEEIETLWEDIFIPRKASTKGELITTIISNSITAFDAFMLVRKLLRQYGSLFYRSKKRKKKG